MINLVQAILILQIKIQKRNNRIVKMLALTDIGKEKLNLVYSKIEEIFADVKSSFTDGEEEKIVQILNIIHYSSL